MTYICHLPFEVSIWPLSMTCSLRWILDLWLSTLVSDQSLTFVTCPQSQYAAFVCNPYLKSVFHLYLWHALRGQFLTFVTYFLSQYTTSTWVYSVKDRTTLNCFSSHYMTLTLTCSLRSIICCDSSSTSAANLSLSLRRTDISDTNFSLAFVSLWTSCLSWLDRSLIL